VQKVKALHALPVQPVIHRIVSQTTPGKAASIARNGGQLLLVELGGAEGVDLGCITACVRGCLG